MAREGSLIIRKLLDSGAIAMFDLFHTVYEGRQSFALAIKRLGNTAVRPDWQTFKINLELLYDKFHTYDRLDLLQSTPLFSPKEPTDAAMLLEKHVLERFKTIKVGELASATSKRLWIEDKTEPIYSFYRRLARFFLYRFIWEFNAIKYRIAESDKRALAAWDYAVNTSDDKVKQDFIRDAISRRQETRSRQGRLKSGTGSVDQSVDQTPQVNWSVGQVFKELGKIQQSNAQANRFSKGTALSARANEWFSSTLPTKRAAPSLENPSAVRTIIDVQGPGPSDASSSRARPKRKWQEHSRERKTSTGRPKKSKTDSDTMRYENEKDNFSSFGHTAADPLLKHLDKRTQDITRFEKVRKGLPIVLDTSILDQVLDKDSALRALANDVAHMNEVVKPASEEVYDVIENNVGRLFDELLPPGAEFEKRKPKGRDLERAQTAVKGLVRIFGRTTTSDDEISYSYDIGELIDRYVEKKVGEHVQIGEQGISDSRKNTDLYKLLRMFDKINPIIDD